MNDEQKKEFYRLCSLIAVEQDRATFESLLQQLNELMEKAETPSADPKT